VCTIIHLASFLILINKFNELPTLYKSKGDKLVLVKVGGKYGFKDKKYGYKDEKGNHIIMPQFDDAYQFVKGIAKVKGGNKEGYVNKAKEIFVEP